MIIKHRIVMELDRSEKKYIDVMQDDKYSRELELHLKVNGMPYMLPEDCVVLVRYKKSNGQGGAYDALPDGRKAWSIDGSVLTVCLAPQVCTVAGDVMLTVTLRHQDSELNCFTICVKVKKGLGADMKSEPYYHVKGFIPQPDDATEGEYLKVASVDAYGNVTAVTTDISAFPAKVSMLENDMGYLTEHQDISGLLPRSELDDILEQAMEQGGFTGEDGKSAYQYALDGGYTGTEEDFARKMAQDAPGLLAGSAEEITPTQVKTALDNGMGAVVTYVDKIYGAFTFDSFTTAEMFSVVYSSGVIDYNGTPVSVSLYGHLATNQWLMSVQMLALKSDVDAQEQESLILKEGAPMAVAGSIGIYNGTNEFTVYIPTKTSHLKNDSGFLTSVPVTSVNGQTGDVTIEAGSGENVPEYVCLEAERLAAVVHSRQNENTISAILSSDYHLPNSSHSYYAQILESITHAGQAMNILRNKVSLDFEAKLGDLIWDNGESQTEAVEDIQLVHSIVSDGNVLERFEGNGNHDHLQSNGVPLSDAQVYANIGIYNKGCVRDSGNRIGGYCYKDYEEFKLRVILLNTSEANDGSFTVSAKQVTWLGEVLAVPEKEGWGTLILSHHPLDWGGSDTAVMKKIKEANGIIANLHGHVHTFAQGVITGTDIPRLAIPNVCFYRNNEYGQNGGAENSEGIEFGTTTTYDKVAGTENDTSFCVLTLDRAAGKLYLDRYGAGIDREEDVPNWEKKGYTNLLPSAEAIDSTDPYNGIGYKNGYYLSSTSPFEGEDSTTVLSGYIPYPVSEKATPGTIYIKGAQWQAISHCRLMFFSETKTSTAGAGINGSNTSGNGALETHFSVETSGDYMKLTPIMDSDGDWVMINQVTSATDIRFFRISLVGVGENLIITVNEPIEG